MAGMPYRVVNDGDLAGYNTIDEADQVPEHLRPPVELPEKQSNEKKQFEIPSVAEMRSRMRMIFKSARRQRFYEHEIDEDLDTTGSPSSRLLQRKNAMPMSEKDAIQGKPDDLAIDIPSILNEEQQADFTLRQVR